LNVLKKNRYKYPITRACVALCLQKIMNKSAIHKLDNI
jgi:hypothetical protein